MNILKFVITLSFICCCIVNPVSADVEYEQLVTEISKLGNTNSVVRQLTVHCLEKNIKKLIKKKQSQIQRLTEHIEYDQEQLKELRNGTLPEWYNENEYEAKWLARIQRYQEKIPEHQNDLKLYEDLLEQVRS